MPDPDEKLLTVADAASYLRRPKHFVVEQTKRGVLRVRRTAGGAPRVLLSDLDRLLEYEQSKKAA